VIAENALGDATIHQAAHDAHHCRTVGSSIDEVPDKHQPATFRMNAETIVSKRRKEFAHGAYLPMNVAHNINGTIKEWSD
jgi:hypothetical protein